MRRPRLRTVLILLNLIVLALPLAGIQVMRLYESALVRQTESELIAQSAFIAAAWRNAFDRVLAYEQPNGEASELEQHSSPTRNGTGARAQDEGSASQYRAPVLDLVDSAILPPQPDPAELANGVRPDNLAYIIGQDLESILKDAQRMTLAAIRIVDHQGIVVATTGEDRYRSLLATEEVALALRGRHISRLREKEDVVDQTALQSVSRTSRIRAFVATPILFEDRVIGVVLLSRTPANIVQALYAKRQLLTYAAALLLGVVVLIAFITSRTIVRPIGVIQDLAKRVSQGDERAMDDIRPGGTLEIAALGEQIAEMGHSLEDRRRYVQEFARHVSHEFKTPLTGLRGAIEMLEDHGDTMTSDQRATFLTNMEGDVTHLHRLTNSLLQLAKADMQEPRQGARTELQSLLQSVASSYSSCEITVTAPERPVQVAASEDAISAVLTQLIDNALIHGKTTSKVVLALSVIDPEPGSRAGRTAAAGNLTGTAVIDVCDNGQGISEGNRDKVLQPFFTTAREQGGTGLGLAIAVRLLASEGGTLELANPEVAHQAGFTSGSSFRIGLPLA